MHLPAERICALALVSVLFVTLGLGRASTARADIEVDTMVQLAQRSPDDPTRFTVLEPHARGAQHYLYAYQELFGSADAIPWRQHIPAAYSHPSRRRETIRYYGPEGCIILCNEARGFGFIDFVGSAVDIASKLKDFGEHIGRMLASAAAPGTQPAAFAEGAAALLAGYQSYDKISGLVQRLDREDHVYGVAPFVVSYPNPNYNFVIVKFLAISDEDAFSRPTAIEYGAGPVKEVQGPWSGKHLHECTAPITTFLSVNGYRGRGVDDRAAVSRVEHTWEWVYVLNLDAMSRSKEWGPIGRTSVSIPFLFYIQEDPSNSIVLRATNELRLVVRPQEQPRVRETFSATYRGPAPSASLNELPYREVQHHVLHDRTLDEPLDVPELTGPAHPDVPITIFRAGDRRCYLGGQEIDTLRLRYAVSSGRVRRHKSQQIKVSAISNRRGPVAGETLGARHTPTDVHREDGGDDGSYHSEVGGAVLYELDTIGDTTRYPPGWMDVVAFTATVQSDDATPPRETTFWQTVRIVDCECGAGVTTAEVPSLLGLTESEAQQRLAGTSFRMEPTTREGPSGTRALRVWEQTPSAGSRLREGGKVRVNVEPMHRVRVPHVVSLTLADALAALGAVRLEGRDHAGRLLAAITDFDAVVVEAQSPQAGTEVDEGSAVALRFSTAMRAPQLVGAYVRAAFERLETLGLAGTEVTTGPVPASGTPLRRVVTLQAPPAGSPIRIGSRVVLTSEVREVAVPDLTGLDRAGAHKRLAAALLLPIAPDPQAPVDPPGLQVVAQSPTAGAWAPVGSEVRFSVARPSTTVPDLLGRTEADARALIAAAGLRSTATGSDERTGPRRVARQSPAPGSKVPLGSPVELVLTSPVQVPDVRGLPEARALETLRAARLSARRVEQGKYAADTPLRVEAQEPLPGVEVGDGAEVTLFLSATPPPPASPAPVEVPALVGKTEEAAVRALASVGLQGRVLRSTAPGVEPWLVVQQFTPPGQRVPTGATVEFQVARSPAPRPVDRRPVPDVRGLRWPEAQAKLKAAGFVAALPTGVPGPTRAATVRASSPPAGTLHDVGAQVTLQFLELR